MRTNSPGAAMLRQLLLPVGLLLLTSLLGVAVAPERALALNRLAVLACGALVFSGVLLAARTPRRFRAAALAVLLGGLAAALLSLVATDWQAGALVPWPAVYRHLPVLLKLPGSGLPNAADGANPRIVAGTMAVLLPLPFSLALWGRGRGVRLISALALPLLAFPLLLSQAPQGFLALALGLGLLLAWRRPRALLPLLTLALAAALGWTVWHWGLPAALVQRLDLGVAARLSIWPAALRMVQDLPFTGGGLNNFPVIFPLYSVTDTVQPHAHNVFLQTAVDQGLLGLAGFLLLFALAFRSGWRLYRRSTDPLQRAAALGCAGGLAAFLGYGLWDSMSLGNKPALAVWALLGLLFAGERLLPPAAAVNPPLPRRFPHWRNALLAFGGLLALLLAPWWGSALLVNLGRVYWNAWAARPEQAASGPVAQAVRLDRLALRLDPANGRALALSGLLAAQAGDDLQAVQAFAAALRRGPGDAKLHYELAEAQYRLGDVEAAVESYRQAGAGLRLLLRSSAAYKTQDYPAAGAWAEIAVRVMPADLRAWVQAGYTRLKLGDLPGARQAFEQAVARFPASSRGYEELASLVYNYLKDPLLAGLVIEQGLASAQPPGAPLYYLRSRLAADRGDLPAAEADARQALALSPYSGGYLAWRGDLSLKQERYAEALARYDDLLAQAAEPDWQWRGHQRKGRVYAAQGDWPNAVAEFQAAITISQQQGAPAAVLADNQAALGSVLLQAGDPPGAAEAYRQALAYNPENRAAREALLKLQVP